MILVVVSLEAAVVMQKVVHAHHALAEQENLPSVKRMEIPASVRAVASHAAVIPIVHGLHALAEPESLRLEKEMATPANVQKDFQNLLKKEKEVETVHLEKDHPIHFNPAQTGHHVLERNLFRKEMMAQEAKALIKKEKVAHLNHVLTDLQVLVNDHSQNVKEVAMRNHLSEKAVLLDHDQAARHDSKRNRLIGKMKVARDLSKTESQVHSIHAAHVRKDVMVSPRGPSLNVKKAVTKNRLRKPSHIHSMQMQVTSRAKRNHFRKKM